MLRGRFGASCYALGARSSWHISIRDRGKSGHLKRVEMIGSSQGNFGLLLAARLRWQRCGKWKGSCMLLAEPEYALPPAIHTCYPMPYHSPPSDRSSVNSALASMRPLSRREVHCSCKAPDTIDPAFLRWNMPIRNHYPPLRGAPRSADLSIISRSSATP